MTTSVTPQTAAQEILRRRAALASMKDFRSYLAETGSVDFQHPPARHHELIIAKLEGLARGDFQRLLIMAPPGSAKSTYCSVQFALWWLAKFPSQNILCASNSEGLAESFNRRRRNVAMSPEWMRLSGTRLSADHQGVGHFSTEKQGGIRAAGVGSSIIGFRSHLNILDDPISGVDQALSSTQLAKQLDWWDQDYRPRLVPGGRELVVSTRWARRDIAGHILERVAQGQEQWEILRLPMLADSPDDPLGRALREPLWPDYYNDRYIVEKMHNVLMWSTQYQQTPLDAAGTWVGAQNIVYEDRAPKDLRYYIAIDLALTVGRGDYTVIIVAGLDDVRRLHIVDMFRERVDVEATRTMLMDLCERYEPLEVLIDDDNASKIFSRLLWERGVVNDHSPPPWRAMPLRGKDKETRASAIRGLFLSDSVRVVRAPWNSYLHKEVIEFPAGETDDVIDALSLLGRACPTLASPSFRDENSDPHANAAVRIDADGNQYFASPLEELFADNQHPHGQRTRI